MKLLLQICRLRIAKVPLSVKKQWGPMMKTYLEERDSLKVILFLLDIRRLPNEDDFQLMDWIVNQQKALIIVLTKADKVNQSTMHANAEKILSAFGVANLHHILILCLKIEEEKSFYSLLKRL